MPRGNLPSKSERFANARISIPVGSGLSSYGRGVPFRTSFLATVKRRSHSLEEATMYVQTALFGLCYVQHTVSTSGLSWLRQEGWAARFLRYLVG